MGDLIQGAVNALESPLAADLAANRESDDDTEAPDGPDSASASVVDA